MCSLGVERKKTFFKFLFQETEKTDAEKELLEKKALENEQELNLAK